MMKEYFTELEAGMQQAINNGNGSPRKLYTRELARLGKRLYAETDSIAWCGITAPFDLLHPLGVTSCFVEFIGAMLASTGDVGPFIEETDHAGYSSDACSYHRSVSDAALKGMMPVPEFLIGTTNPCNWGCRQGAGARGLIEQGLKEIGVPVLNLEVDCVDSRKFTEGQLRTRLEAFMELLDNRPPLWR